MSSKLLRGKIRTEQVDWQRVSRSDPQSLEGQPFAYGDPGPPGLPGSAGGITHEMRPAYQQGYQEGQAAARHETGAQLEAINGRLARTIEELTGLRARFRHEAEEDVVALSLAIARRILHRELTMAPEALLGLIKAAFEKIELREVHRVRVSRQDVAMVAQHLEQMGLPHRVEVIADPTLESGAAVLDSSRGMLDASVETQLAEIERGFADLVRRT